MNKRNRKTLKSKVKNEADEIPSVLLLCPFVQYTREEHHRILNTGYCCYLQKYVYSFFDPLNKKFFINNNRKKMKPFLQVNKCFTRTPFRCIDVDNNSSCLVFGEIVVFFFCASKWNHMHNSVYLSFSSIHPTQEQRANGKNCEIFFTHFISTSANKCHCQIKGFLFYFIFSFLFENLYNWFLHRFAQINTLTVLK